MSTWLVLLTFGLLYLIRVIKTYRRALHKYSSMWPKYQGRCILIDIFMKMFELSTDNAANFKKILQICTDFKRFLAFFAFGRLFLVLYSAQDIEKVLSSNVNIKKSIDYEPIIPWIGYGLLTSTGEKWKTHRKILTPAFHFKILEDFVEVFNRNGEILCDKLKAHVGGGAFNIYKYVNLAAFDNICETAMGIQMNVQQNEDSEYLKAVKEICNIAYTRAFWRWLMFHFIFRMTSLYGRQEKAIKILHETTENVIKKRKEELRKLKEKNGNEKVADDGLNRKRRLTFLDALLESREDSVMTDQDIREEVDTFMFEGHDTVSSGLGFVLYSLAANPDVQDKAYEEQKLIFESSDRLPTFRDLQDMKYLEQVIKESQRLYPSVPIYARHTDEVIELEGGYTVPKGTQIIMMIHQLHRDPEVFPDPEKFDADRFTPEATQKRHPYAYVPFSAGPRNCIGQRFAMLEMKSTVSKILRKYQLLKSSDPKDELELVPELVLVSRNGINVKIVDRTD